MANTADSESHRFGAAIRRMDEVNSGDPVKMELEGKLIARELVYARWLTDWVTQLAPDASEALRLAARCQHIARWEIPRTAYPETREGYLEWRARLKLMHADKGEAILSELGYPDEIVQRVRSLNLKQNLKQDPECQVLEDALCLVFLEHQLSEMTERYADEKLVNAVKKSWTKMSQRGHEAALRVQLPASAQRIVELALRPC
jgi:hypothetical protein